MSEREKWIPQLLDYNFPQDFLYSIWLLRRIFNIVNFQHYDGFLHFPCNSYWCDITFFILYPLPPLSFLCHFMYNRFILCFFVFVFATSLCFCENILKLCCSLNPLFCCYVESITQTIEVLKCSKFVYFELANLMTEITLILTD